MQRDPVRTAVFGLVAAGGGAVLWGELAIFTGSFRNWLAVPLGLVIGACLRWTGRESRGRGLQAFALALTSLAWLVALYIAFFGLHITEISEHQGADAADRVPVTLMFTLEFLRHFASELPESLPAGRLAWLVAGLVAAALLTRARSGPSSTDHPERSSSA